MENSIHRLGDLFKQLGLADDVASIERFIRTHRPLSNATPVADAPCWTASRM